MNARKQIVKKEKKQEIEELLKNGGMLNPNDVELVIVSPPIPKEVEEYLSYIEKTIQGESKLTPLTQSHYTRCQ